MSPFPAPRRTPRQARSGDKLLALEQIAVQLLLEKGRGAVTPKALVEAYREAGGRISKQWVSDYMGDGRAIVVRIAAGHFTVLARYAEEAGALALMSPDLEHAARILALHVMGAQDPWFGQAHPALCKLIVLEGQPIQGQWIKSVASAVNQVLARFQPGLDPALRAGPATSALIAAWCGLVLEGRQGDEHRLAYLMGAFLGVVRAAERAWPNPPGGLLDP